MTHLLTVRASWFFGSMLALIAIVTGVRILREETGAFADGAVALQLLGLLPIIITRLPTMLHAEAPEGAPRWGIRTTLTFLFPNK